MTDEPITLRVIHPSVASLVTFGDQALPDANVADGGVYLTMDAARHEALGSPETLTVSVSPPPNLDALRRVVRKMNRLLPGPRGREVAFTREEHEALMAAIGDDNTDHRIGGD